MATSRDPAIEAYLNNVMGQLRAGIPGGVACTECDAALAGPSWELTPPGHTQVSWAGHLRGHLTRNEIPFSLLRLALRRHYVDDGAGMWAVPGSHGRQAGVNGYDTLRVRAALREYLTLVATA
jgi:hypothetical protein